MDAAQRKASPHTDYKLARRTINSAVDAIEFGRRYWEASKLTDILVNGSITSKFDSAEALYYLINLDRPLGSAAAERAFVEAVETGNETTKNISMKYIRKILVEKEVMKVEPLPEPKEDLIMSDIAEMKKRHEKSSPSAISAEAFKKKIDETRIRSATILKELFESKDISVSSKVDELLLEVINNGNTDAKDVISPILNYFSTSTDEVMRERAAKLNSYDINAFLRRNGKHHK